jgi:hypothetical protein
VDPGRESGVAPGTSAELTLALDLTTATGPAGVGVARPLGELARRDRLVLVLDNADELRAHPGGCPRAPTSC